MSHFCVLVVGDDIESQMAPYQENNNGDIDPELLEFIDETEEVKEAWKDYPLTVLAEGGSEDDYKNIQEYVAGYWGYEEQDGRYGYMENPNAKWDGWCVGGRWSNYLTRTDGGKVDYATVGEIYLHKLEPTWAVLYNGQWIERGEMMMFGMSKGDKYDEDWAAEFSAVVRSLHPDTFITVVDCHI